MYTWKVGEKEYELKLTIKALMRLEKAIGANPLMIFGRDGQDIPTTAVIISIIHAAIQNDTLMTEDVVCGLVDQWIEEGHEYAELMTLVIDIYKASGLFSEEEEDTGKNAKKGKSPKA